MYFLKQHNTVFYFEKKNDFEKKMLTNMQSQLINAIRKKEMKHGHLKQNILNNKEGDKKKFQIS